VIKMSDQLRTKRRPGAFQLHRQSTDIRGCAVVGEHQILELISVGAALPGILNKLCMMIDVRIGDVVSIVSLADAEENHFCSVTNGALQGRLEIFSTRAILSPDGSFLGTLEIYGCDPRRPTSLESHLIDRVTHLASMALQHRESDDGLERPYAKPRSRLPAPIEKPPFIN
jgi:hypothetical protein